ncbi:MAG: glycosyl hydrolase family 28-related protein [Fimbriimonas sp.]
MSIPLPVLLSMTVATTQGTMLKGDSFYRTRLEDAKAVYLTPDRFPVKGDGVADDTDGIQQAIDRVQETTGQGILFVPEGRYRLSKTLTVWPGVRVIGYGAKRPVFLLADHTKGYQDTEKFMVFFAGRRPNGPTEQPPVPESAGRAGGDFGLPNDANPGTFYSAMSNVDIEIGAGNPAAVAIRSRYAQHCYLAHMDFRLGSALAGIHDTGNEADDLRFFGGQYGIITRTPSPGWQFTLMDSHFEGQREAAIRTRVTGLTLIRPSFKSVPTAIAVDPDQTEQLYVKDARMEDVTGPAVTISREHSLRTQINLENVVCRRVPTFAQFRESGRRIAAPGEIYRVATLSHGLHYAKLGEAGRIETKVDAKALAAWPAPVTPDVPPLPGTDTWVNLMALGAKGDGTTDDTAVLKEAIARHRAIYLPSGKYRVTDSIVLRPDTILIGLNPITTQILITDGTPGFVGVSEGESAPGRRPRLLFPGNPKALLETPKGGTNIVTGVGLDTGGNNPAAVAAKWMAGSDSMMDDVKFIGGHGSGVPIYNQNNSADPNPERRWDSQYPSLWVTDGGGGTFKNLWTASTFATSGMTVSNTTTEGRVYQMSSEHHVRYEVQVRNAANWHFYALQTEEERGEGPFASALEIENSSNITVANFNAYRVVSVTQPFPYAIKVTDSKDVRFRNVHCYSNSKASYDNLLIDNGTELRQREFAWLTLTGDRVKPKPSRVEKLAGGFHNISGGAVHPNGDFYFVDPRWHRIHRWDTARRQVSIVQDAPLHPVNLAFDRAGNLMVVSYAGRGTVYAFRPGEETVTPLKAEPASARPGMTAALPVTDWMLHPRVVAGEPLTRPFHFVSPDRKVFLPVGQDFIDGTLTWGVKLQDVIRTFALDGARPGRPFYVMGESEMRTYAVDVQPDGTMANPRLFAECGGEGLAVAPNGNVYIAMGQIYVYAPDGRLLDTIEVPERPTALAFGGKDGKTLFITARTSLYSMRIR